MARTDALSRLMNSQKLENDDTVIVSMSGEEDVGGMLTNVVRILQVTTAGIADRIHRDLVLKQRAKLIRRGRPSYVTARQLKQH
ncbi:unnamed protein product [Schistosoma mattheei]|uniref:Uncharacterized protein n=1 Tax=Schistosoma mattheei TaxID=31246 RepID=A0A183Q452_9TREM|nr:unnamed protein product [Schistosoma mattheei]